MKSKQISIILCIVLLLCCLPTSHADAIYTVHAEKIVSAANSLVGKYPYIPGGESPAEGGFDCTGLVYYVYHDLGGISMTLEQARSKSKLLALGTKIDSMSAFEPGDIVQFNYSHVAIYIGDGIIVEASKPGTLIRTRKINSQSQVEYAVRLPQIAQYEKALFPAYTVDISQIAYSSYSHSGRNVTDICPHGRAFAPFTGTVKYIDHSWGYVIIQSNDMVYYADGSLDYMTVGFMHDNDVSDLKVGDIIQQGQEFYDAGTKSNRDNIKGAHIHLVIIQGKFKDAYCSHYSTHGDTYPYNAFFLADGTSIKDRGYDPNLWIYETGETSTGESSLSLKAFNAPNGHYDSLPNFGLRGIFTSNCKITRVAASVVNDSGIAVMNYDETWNSTSYNIRYDGINQAFSFGTLPNGSYTYTVTAYDERGGSKSQSSCFDIGSNVDASAGKSDLLIKEFRAPSGYYDSLPNFGLRGIFTSNCKITRVAASVVNDSGIAVMNYDETWNSMSYNIRYDGINQAFSFGTLPNGSYTYTVTAYDERGGSKSQSSCFDIGSNVDASAGKSDLLIKEFRAPSGYYDSLPNFGLRGIFTSNCKITRVAASVVNDSGIAVMNYDETWNSTSYNIRYDGINQAFSFGTLPNGNYTYTVTAYDERGGSLTQSSSFYIGITV